MANLNQSTQNRRSKTNSNQPWKIKGKWPICICQGLVRDEKPIQTCSGWLGRGAANSNLYKLTGQCPVQTCP